MKILKKFLTLYSFSIISIDSHKLSLVINHGSWVVFHGQGILSKKQNLHYKKHRPPKKNKRDPNARRKVQELDC